MLIDINAYVGHWPFHKVQYNTCNALLERMNKFGVELSVIANMNGIFYKNTQSANEELYEEIKSNRKFQNRFIPFATINPIYADWKYDLEVSYRKLGMMGVHLYPQYHDYNANEPQCIELVKIARNWNIPVAFSLRMVDKRERSWMDVDRGLVWRELADLVKSVPDAKYMFLNKFREFIIRNEPSENDKKVELTAGGISGDRRITKEDIRIFKSANIMFDTSGRSINILQIFKLFGKDKVAFGSHSPILDYLTGLIRIEELREDEADEETKELIRSGNAKKFLGL